MSKRVRIQDQKVQQCKAKAKNTGERCKNPCIRGKTVCRLHGGKSNGAPKGSKNALKHGAYETLSADVLTQDEIAYAESVTTDIVQNLENDLRMLRVRERRIFMRLKKALEAESNAGKTGEDGKMIPALMVIGGTQSQTQHADGSVTKVAGTTSESYAVHIMRLESGLNIVQDQIRKVLDSLAKYGGQDADGTTQAGVLVSPGILSEALWEAQAQK